MLFFDEHIHAEQIEKSTRKLLTFLFGIGFVLFPIMNLPQLSNALQNGIVFLLLVLVVCSLLLIGYEKIFVKKVTLFPSRFTFAIGLFAFFVLLSSLFAVNRMASLVAMLPLLAGVASIFFLAITSQVDYLLLCLLIGASMLALFQLLSLFSFQTIQLPSSLDLLVFFVALFPLAILSAIRYQHAQKKLAVLFVVSSIVMATGLCGSIISLIMHHPVLLSFQAGLQIAFSEVSQDNGRVLQGFLLGSGFGTFVSDFTRFKPVTLNTDPLLWQTTFGQSSSFLLELLATTGILGTVSFLFSGFSLVIFLFKKHNNIALPISILLVAMFVAPFDFFLLTCFFFLAGMGLAMQPAEKSLPIPRLTAYGISFFCAAASIFLVVIGMQYFLADYHFSKSLHAAINNNGAIVYQEQRQAITYFPYQDTYFAGFSQTNIAIATNLLTINQTNASQAAQVTLAYKLIQQGIQSAKTAVALSPENASLWNNVAVLYRKLIGQTKNADTFALLASKQAIVLDPVNPKQYMDLGGLYYQLGQYDNAILAFQKAIQLKPDYANAYYNLGHTFEQMKDLKDAVIAYQNVKALVVNDSQSEKQITDEIRALEDKEADLAAISVPVVTPVPHKTQQKASGQTLQLLSPLASTSGK